MIYKSYKNRTIDLSEKAMIYKNLHNGLFSVKQKGLVVAHIESFKMSSVIFKVVESGRQRVIKEQKKNVHAFIIGYLSSVNAINFDELNITDSISYNPYKLGYFYRKSDNEKAVLTVSDLLHCHSKKGLFLVK